MVCNILGVDPGTKGCLCIISASDEAIDRVKFFRLSKYAYDELPEILREEEIHRAYLETPGMPPGNGKISYAKVAYSKGILEGILLGVGIRPIKLGPTKWMNALDCKSGGDKNVTKQKAMSLYPSHKFTHHDSDAFLIAYYGAFHEPKTVRGIRRKARSV